MEADYLILADGAQVAGDKLYVMGGGWIAVFARQFPVNHSMTVAIGLLVDWLETNRQHTFRLEVREEDSQNRVIVSVDGSFEQGRPPGMTAGSRQRIQMAIPFTFKLERPGEYAVRLLLDGHEFRKSSFTVKQAPQGLMPEAPAAPPDAR